MCGEPPTHPSDTSWTHPSEGSRSGLLAKWFFGGLGCHGQKNTVFKKIRVSIYIYIYIYIYFGISIFISIYSSFWGPEKLPPLCCRKSHESRWNCVREALDFEGPPSLHAARLRPPPLTLAAHGRCVICGGVLDGTWVASSAHAMLLEP